MTEIKITEFTLNNVKQQKIFLTQAGRMAVETPLPAKEYIYNEDRGINGKEYVMTDLSQPKDDLAVSVQFVATDDDVSVVNNFVSGFERATKIMPIGGIGGSFLYKGCSGLTQQGDYILFTLNLIKLAENESND